MTCNICRNDHDNQSNEYLIREYLELNKARFNRIFGHNAARCQTNVATALINRSITQIPNIFGPIPVRR